MIKIADIKITKEESKNVYDGYFDWVIAIAESTGRAEEKVINPFNTDLDGKIVCTRDGGDYRIELYSDIKVKRKLKFKLWNKKKKNK